MIVFLDSGILGLMSSPNERSEVTACQNWVFGLLAKGVIDSYDFSLVV